MGCCESDPSSGRPISPSEVPIKKAKFKWESGGKILQLPFKITTPPMIKGNQAIFLDTDTETNTSQYITVDLSKRQFTSADPIQFTDFDISNTVYTLNTKENKIYFIHNNKDIKILDLSSNTLETLNKSVQTTQNNFAQIWYSAITDKTYIFGAEAKSDTVDGCENIPYSLAITHKSDDVYIARIMKFGLYARVCHVNMDGSDWVFIAGGEKKFHTGVTGPTDALWHYVITNDEAYPGDRNDMTKQKWQHHYLAHSAHSFGMVNYENEYIFCFGGVIRKKDKALLSNAVYFLPLTEKDQTVSHKRNRYTGILKGWWYELERRLPNREYCYCAYEKSAGDVIHLFTYDGGYYTLNVKDILDEMVVNGDGYHKKRDWTERGLVYQPIRPLELHHMMPKGDVNDMLRAMSVFGDCCDDYCEIMDDQNIETYQDLIAKKDILSELITNSEDFSAILAKAQELYINIHE